MSNPFYPYGSAPPLPWAYPQQQQEPQPQQPQPFLVPQPQFYGPPQEPPTSISCDYCSQEIIEGELAVDIMFGTVERSKKTGQGTVNPTVEDLEASGKVHPWCAEEFVRHFIYEDDGPEPERLCAACEAPLIDDEE